MIYISDLNHLRESYSFSLLLKKLKENNDSNISVMENISLNDVSSINDDFRVSNLILEDLSSIIDTEHDNIYRYIMSRDAYYLSKTKNEAQSYSKYEEPDIKERDVILSVSEEYPFSSIISFIIEYYFLSTNSIEKLKDRIKSLRIPKPLQFRKELLAIYKSSVNIDDNQQTV